MNGMGTQESSLEEEGDGREGLTLFFFVPTTLSRKASDFFFLSLCFVPGILLRVAPKRDPGIRNQAYRADLIKLMQLGLMFAFYNLVQICWM